MKRITNAVLSIIFGMSLVTIAACAAETGADEVLSQDDFVFGATGDTLVVSPGDRAFGSSGDDTFIVTSFRGQSGDIQILDPTAPLIQIDVLKFEAGELAFVTENANGVRFFEIALIDLENGNAPVTVRIATLDQEPLVENIEFNL